MPLPRISRRPSVAATPHWLIQACFPVLLAMVFGGVQVAALWFDGFFLRTNETIAAPPATGGVSCSNCGWWPWNDKCQWVETGFQRGVSFSEPQKSSYKDLCVSADAKEVTWKCTCSISIGEKLYKWMPAIKVSLTLPPYKALQAFQITGDWDANKTITKAMTQDISGPIPPGSCGPEIVYCYRSRDYYQTLYRRQVGTVTGVTVIHLQPGIDSVNYTYSYATCNNPCVGDFSILEGPPSPQLSYTEYAPPYFPPLADPCK